MKYDQYYVCGDGCCKWEVYKFERDWRNRTVCEVLKTFTVDDELERHNNKIKNKKKPARPVSHAYLYLKARKHALQYFCQLSGTSYYEEFDGL